MRCFTLTTGLILALTGMASATTYVVNPEGTGDFPTIQAAIDAVVHGDIIELTDGTFTGDGNRDIDYLGKAITVRSQSGIAAGCIIDCVAGDQHRGFWFRSGEGLQSLVEGITVTGGWAEGYPGGASAVASSACGCAFLPW